MYNIIEVKNKMEEIKWIYIQTVQVGAFWYDEYVSEDGKKAKQVWHDGFEEIYSCA